MECISLRKTIAGGFDQAARTFYTVQDLNLLSVFYLTKTVTHISRESDSGRYLASARPISLQCSLYVLRAIVLDAS